MQLGTRRAGTSTSFIDSGLSEDLLTCSSDESGRTQVSFCLYDCSGALVQGSEGFQRFP